VHRPESEITNSATLLTQDFLDHVRLLFHSGQFLIQTLKTERQLSVIDSQLVQDGGV
jgi:hypothetical protein